MGFLRYFQHSGIKKKLILSFIATLVPVLLLGGYGAYTYFKRSIISNAQADLKETTENLARMIETAATVSIRNYLRAVAEKNLEIIEGYYADHLVGRISEAQFIAVAKNLLQRQHIGRDGYIYCLDSTGTAVLHPDPAIQGTNLLPNTFAHRQINEKVGYLEYDWQNSYDATPRPKALYMVYFEPLDWIISVSAYREEFSSLVHYADLQEYIQAMHFGESGYAFITDGNGNYLIHPNKNQYKNIAEAVHDGEKLMDTISHIKAGRITYELRATENDHFHPRQAYFKFIDKYDWYIGASFLESEIYGPLSLVRVLIVVFTLIIFILCVAVAIGFSEYINRHINRLINAFGQGAAGALNTRYETLAGDEFGQLAHYFNTFMARLESNRQSLVEEIEKRRQMQQVIHESEKRLKTLVKNAPVLLWAVDASGMLTFFEGNLPAQFIDEIQISDEVPVADSLRTMGPPMDGLADHIENALIGNPGSLQITFQGFAIEIHSNPFYNDQHQLIGVVGVAIDVTSRWQAERRFSEAEKERLKLAMAVEQADEIIVITDTAGTIEYVNPAFEKSSGYTKSETIGHRPNILKSGKHDNAFYKKLWLTISNGKTWSSRIINKKKDGSLFYEDATISPMRDKNGKIVNYVASKRDVTQEVILEDQLEHSQRMKAIGTLAGGIAHDFNNILSGIMGYADLCLYDAPKPSLLSDQLGKILEAAHRAKDLIGHIQTFSRQQTVEPIPMLPAPVMSEALKLIQASYPAITLRHNIQNVGVIMAAPTHIHQIVMNLCTNACHAMNKQNGTLTVDLTKQFIDARQASRILDIGEGEYAVLVVADTGSGIPADIAEKIFEPYFTTKAEGEGTGLGLSVVHGIVKDMGGAISLDSQLSVGTTFTIYLPLLRSGAEPETRQDHTIPTGNGEHILLVDDEQFVLETTSKILESLNYRVSARSSTIDALKLFQSAPDRFDLVYTDLTLPVMDGIAFSLAVRQLVENMPIIISSGFSEDAKLDAMRKQGLVDYINKPIIRTDVAQKIASLLHQARSSATANTE